MGFQLDSITSDAHTIAGCGVSCDRDVRGAYANAVLKADNACDIEDHDARASCFARFAKTSWAVVVEVRNHKHLTASPAEAIHSTTIGAGKGRNLRLG